MKEKPSPLLAGLIGWPVQQSKSPIIHGHWLRTAGIDGEYVRLPVEPGAVGAALKAIRDLGFVGVQATMPHKHACFDAVDHVTDTAKAIGTVNTVIVQQDGGFLGHNTDMEGFLEPLDSHDLTGKVATLCGAGGAAAGIIVGLAAKKVSAIHIINRSAKSIDSLLNGISSALVGIEIQALDWSRADDCASNSDIIINATSLGMAGQPDLPIRASALPPDAIAYDIVTHPHRTAFLASAAQRGMICFDGLQMLIGQAREAFALFYGQEAPTDEDDAIREALLTS
jgi:shikimate dehydrogenase